MSCIQSQLPESYDLLIIDGPLFDDRNKIFKYHEMFKIKDIPVIVDDTWRSDGDEIAKWVCETYNKKIIFVATDNGKEQSRVLL
mgnify:CR=1 FL=1